MNEGAPHIGHVNLADKVYNRIRAAILDGAFSDRQRLVCGNIAKKFGVSATPVRESLVRLTREGFVYSIARKGTYVSSFTKKDIQNIYEIREVLEGLAARMAARSLNPELLIKMSQACDEYESAIKENDLNLCINNDLRFHRLLAQASGSQRLVEILTNFHLQIISIAKEGTNYWIVAPNYLSEHRSIAELISQGKAELAEERMKEHIRKGKERIEK